MLYNWYWFGIIKVRGNHMHQRPTEARHPGSDGLHAADGQDALAILLDAQVAALQSVRSAIPTIQRAAEAAARALSSGGKLAYAGAGSSGLMALADCLELAGTFGIPPAETPMMFAGGTAALLHMTGDVEDDLGLAQADFDAARLKAGDVLLCLSASGRTPYALEVARLAKGAGVLVVGIANVAGSALLETADIAVLLDTGPEVISGSTRMGAATAQKAALNMISVLVGIRLGHVYDGYMVNLVADNGKLTQRATQIVSAVSGASEDDARRALELTGGFVKAAVLVARGSKPTDALAALKKSDGNLGPLLHE
jgi:N-acetylmuramic acid 6-phosphate etherase